VLLPLPAIALQTLVVIAVYLLSKELRLLLSHPNYKTRASRIKPLIQTEDGVTTACDTIEAGGLIS
jgi:UDP:flavonoid glycosyltransferase YjiC (YdhE family)